MKRAAALIVPDLALVAASAAAPEDKADKDVRRSVVRVLATQRVPDALKPWLKQSPRDSAAPASSSTVNASRWALPRTPPSTAWRSTLRPPRSSTATANVR